MLLVRRVSMARLFHFTFHDSRIVNRGSEGVIVVAACRHTRHSRSRMAIHIHDFLATAALCALALATALFGRVAFLSLGALRCAWYARPFLLH